jgi:hypothetical protein
MPHQQLTIDELLDHALTHARTVLMEKDAQLIPTWLIQAKDRTTIIGTPWNGDDEKDFMLFAVRQMLKNEKADSYSFLSEAWMATEDIRHPIGLAPGEREDRREVVMIHACNRDGVVKVRMYDMKRGADGTVTDLIPEELQPDRFEGRMVNLFKKDSHAG